MPGRILQSVTAWSLDDRCCLLLIGAVVSPAVASSNKTIQIDEDLRVNAEVLKVTLEPALPHTR